MRESELNPYAAPQSDTSAGILRTGTPGSVWREEDILVMDKKAELPDRCVKCNAPSHGRRLNRNLSWHPSGWYVLIVISLWIYIIAALIVRHTAKIRIGLCETHIKQRRKRIAIGWLLAILAVVLAVVAAMQPDSSSPLVWLWLVALVAFIASLVIAVMVSRLAVPKRIDKHYVWLKNIHPDYLDSLPPANAAPLGLNPTFTPGLEGATG